MQKTQLRFQLKKVYINLKSTSSIPVCSNFSSFLNLASSPKAGYRRKAVTVPEFIPTNFKPANGEQEKSFDLYKTARIVDPADVYESEDKYPWYKFDSAGK